MGVRRETITFSILELVLPVWLAQYAGMSPLAMCDVLRSQGGCGHRAVCGDPTPKHGHVTEQPAAMIHRTLGQYVRRIKLNFQTSQPLFRYSHCVHCYDPL